MPRVSRSTSSLLPEVPKEGMPVTVLTGFLGSGKTTLLRHLLQENQGRKIAAIVNELGSLDIDSQLLVNVGSDVLELSNGCLCCTINESLVNTVFDILERPERVDYLVIETTGVADPLPIALTFLGTELQHLTRLDAILTLIDASSFTADAYNSQAAYNQVRYADQILLTKTDLATPLQQAEAMAALEDIRSKPLIHECQHGQIPLSLVLDLGLSASEELHYLEQQGPVASDHLSGDGFLAVPFKSRRPFDLAKFDHFLNQQLPTAVCRGKGLLQFAHQEGQYVFQLSGQRFSLDRAEGPLPPGNQLVLIGRGLNALALTQSLNNCLAVG